MIQRGTPAQFYNDFINDTATVLHEVDVDTTVLLNYLSFFNNDASAVEVDVWIVPTGESPGDAFRRFHEEIGPLTTYEFLNSTPLLLKEGDTIQVSASVDDVISVFCSGVLLELA